MPVPVPEKGLPPCHSQHVDCCCCWWACSLWSWSTLSWQPSPHGSVARLSQGSCPSSLWQPKVLLHLWKRCLLLQKSVYYFPRDILFWAQDVLLPLLQEQGFLFPSLSYNGSLTVSWGHAVVPPLAYSFFYTWDVGSDGTCAFLTVVLLTSSSPTPQREALPISCPVSHLSLGHLVEICGEETASGHKLLCGCSSEGVCMLTVAYIWPLATDERFS